MCGTAVRAKTVRLGTSLPTGGGSGTGALQANIGMEWGWMEAGRVQAASLIDVGSSPQWLTKHGTMV